MLDSLLHDGKEYAFISNIDNLTATVDLDILYHLYCNDVEMCMEVTSPVRTDNDGGYLVKKVGEEGTRFIEINEVAEEDREDFKRRFEHYNTNNLWVNLRALKRQIEAGDYGDTVIAQERVMENNMKVLQLETTAGSLINKMQSTLAVVVERRKRYVPVKTTADLMLIQSNIFSILHGALHLNPSLITMPLPTVKLGKEFMFIDEYVRRIPIQQQHTANIAELEHLTIAGDVFIGKNVTLKGTGVCSERPLRSMDCLFDIFPPTAFNCFSAAAVQCCSSYHHRCGRERHHDSRWVRARGQGDHWQLEDSGSLKSCHSMVDFLWFAAHTMYNAMSVSRRGICVDYKS